MKYKKIEEKNYNIYLLKSNKFKTINISTVLINNYKKEDITKEKFISEYLSNTNETAKSEVLMSKKYMELYDPRINVSDVFRDVHLKIYNLTFLNEKYTEIGMNEKTIDFYYDIVYKPNVKDDNFEKSNFEIVKETMKSWYLREEEDSSATAFFNAISHVRDKLPIKLDIRGNKKDLEKIDRNELYSYYKEELKNSKFLVFVTGDYNDDVIDSIKRNLDNKVSKNDYNIKKYFPVNKSNDVLEISDDSNFTQSILYIIYKVLNMTDREREYVLPVMNNILGGSSAKLFNNVREKHSLAYYAYSDVYAANNILYMYAGISLENYEKCTKLMKEQVNEMINGNVSQREIDGAKESIYSSLLKTDDSLSGISSSLKGNVIFGITPYDELKKNFETVTKEEIINLSKKLNLDVIYLLKGAKK